MGLGLFMAAPGPALLDLQLLAGTSFGKAAMLLPARSLGYALGSVIAGVLGERMDHQIVIMVSLCLSIVTMTAFPLFRSINIMYGLIFASGISNGCINTIVNIW